MNFKNTADRYNRHSIAQEKSSGIANKNFCRIGVIRKKSQTGAGENSTKYNRSV